MAKLISTFLHLFVANMPKWVHRKGLHQFLQREEKVNDTKANTAQNSNWITNKMKLGQSTWIYRKAIVNWDR